MAESEAQAQAPTQDAASQAQAAPDQNAGLAPEQGAAAEAAATDTPATEPAAQAPEQDGDFTLTAPEGLEAFAPQFAAFAGQMDGWLKANPGASARDALAEAARLQAQTVADSQAAATAQVETWGNDARRDPELGGDAFDANVAQAKKALATFGTPALTDLLNASGLGNHPEVIRAFFKAGALLKDADVITASDPVPQRKSLASALYGGKA